MATSILYEGDGFLRCGPAYLAKPITKDGANPAERTAAADAQSVQIEKREKALRREYLPEWICRLLDD